MVWLCHHSSEPSTISRVDAKESMEYGAGRSAGLLPGPTSIPFSIEPGTQVMQQISTVTCHNIIFSPTWTVVLCLWNSCGESAHTGMSKQCDILSSMHILFVLFMTIQGSTCPLPSLFGPRVLSNPEFKFELHLLSETARRWPQPRHKDHSKLSLNAFAFFHTWRKSKDKMWIANDCSCIVKDHLKSRQTPKFRGKKTSCLIRDRWHFVDMVKCFWSLHLNIFFIYVEVSIQGTRTWLHHSLYQYIYECTVM